MQSNWLGFDVVEFGLFRLCAFATWEKAVTIWIWFDVGFVELGS